MHKWSEPDREQSFHSWTFWTTVRNTWEGEENVKLNFAWVEGGKFRLSEKNKIWIPVVYTPSESFALVLPFYSMTTWLAAAPSCYDQLTPITCDQPFGFTLYLAFHLQFWLINCGIDEITSVWQTSSCTNGLRVQFQQHSATKMCFCRELWWQQNMHMTSPVVCIQCWVDVRSTAMQEFHIHSFIRSNKQERKALQTLHFTTFLFCVGFFFVWLLLSNRYGGLQDVVNTDECAFTCFQEGSVTLSHARAPSVWSHVLCWGVTFSAEPACPPPCVFWLGSCQRAVPGCTITHTHTLPFQPIAWDGMDSTQQPGLGALQGRDLLHLLLLCWLAVIPSNSISAFIFPGLVFRLRLPLMFRWEGKRPRRRPGPPEVYVTARPLPVTGAKASIWLSPRLSARGGKMKTEHPSSSSPSGSQRVGGASSPRGAGLLLRGNLVDMFERTIKSKSTSCFSS